MVDPAVLGTNSSQDHATYIDNIEFFQKCHWKNTSNYREIYLEKGLSAAQIGEQLGIPKRTVLNQLKREGIRLGTNKGRLVNPENYRLAYAPFGFLKKEGRLVPNKFELKICRTVVRLHNNSKMSFYEIARELERRRIKGRSESISWTHTSVGRIYKRWNGKL